MAKVSLIEVLHRIYQRPTTELAQAVEAFGKMVGENPQWDWKLYDPATARIGKALPVHAVRATIFEADDVVRCCFVATDSAWIRRTEVEAYDAATLICSGELDIWTQRATAFRSIAELERAMLENDYCPTFIRRHDVGSKLGEWLEQKGHNVRWLNG